MKCPRCDKPCLGDPPEGETTRACLDEDNGPGCGHRWPDVKRLAKELEALSQVVNSIPGDAGAAAHHAIDALKTLAIENQCFREALLFYAEPRTYEGSPDEILQPSVLVDSGRKARNALGLELVLSRYRPFTR